MQLSQVHPSMTWKADFIKTSIRIVIILFINSGLLFFLIYPLSWNNDGATPESSCENISNKDASSRTRDASNIWLSYWPDGIWAMVSSSFTDLFLIQTRNKLCLDIIRRIYFDIITLNSIRDNIDEFLHQNFKRIVNVKEIDKVVKLVTVFFSSASLDVMMLLRLYPCGNSS